jgi:hypothetical protein
MVEDHIGLSNGRFDEEAVARSPQDWFSRNRARMGMGLVAAAVGGLGIAVTSGLRRRKLS